MDLTYIFIGLIVGVIAVRNIKNFVAELSIFGGVIGLIFAWHWEFVTFLGLPHMPEQVYKFGAGLLFFWIFYRIWLFIVNQTKRSSPLRKLTKFIFSKVEKLE